jgi:hypothetical protein
MQFAITVDTHVGKWNCIKVAEDLGTLCTGRYATTAWHESDDG